MDERRDSEPADAGSPLSEVERKLFDEIIQNRTKILDDFARAYIAETGLMPSQVVLCFQQSIEGDKLIERHWFERKEEP